MRYKGWFHRLSVGIAADSVKSWKWEFYPPLCIFSIILIASVVSIASGGFGGSILLILSVGAVIWLGRDMGKLRHMSVYGRVKFFAKYYGVSPYEVFTELMKRAEKRVKRF